ncbi:Co-chaperone [Vanrija albida]|uniref:Co-chaperone n=1 Tax=Vanrija albida TaxID=181172 RepID=A0ABR3QFJ1_9TREE
MAEPAPLTNFQQTYHWRNKNCGPWAQEWVKKELPGLSATDGAYSAEITEVTSVSGDCDLGQRKGKLLTIYDLEVEAKWKGAGPAGEEVTGRLSIPEFSHEMIDGISEYVFNFSADSADADNVLGFARRALAPVLETRLNGFRLELLNAHGIFEGASAATSGASTPALQSYSPAPPGEVRSKAATPAPKPASPAPAADKNLKTVTVEVSATLHASADDLWSILTDEARVPMWSRAAAKIKPVAGEPYELFGGNVSGKIVEAERPTKLVQTWQTKSPGWPSDHYGTMTITLKQGSDSTAVTFSLAGVPASRESDIERALNGFYIQGLKQMGLVVSSSSRTFVETAPARPRRAKKAKAAAAADKSVLERITQPQVIAGAAAVGLAAVFVGLVASTFARPPN